MTLEIIESIVFRLLPILFYGSKGLGKLLPPLFCNFPIMYFSLLILCQNKQMSLNSCTIYCGLTHLVQCNPLSTDRHIRWRIYNYGNLTSPQKFNTQLQSNNLSRACWYSSEVTTRFTYTDTASLKTNGINDSLWLTHTYKVWCKGNVFTVPVLLFTRGRGQNFFS